MVEDKNFWAEFKGLLMYELVSGRVCFTAKGRAVVGPALRGVGVNYRHLKTLGEFKKAWFEVQLRKIKLNQEKALKAQTPAKATEDVSEALVP